MANSRQNFFLALGFCAGCLFTWAGGYESSIAYAQALVHGMDVSYDNNPHEIAAERVQTAIEEINSRQNSTISRQGTEAMATTTTTVSGAINELVARIATLEGRITALQTKTASMSRTNNTLTFTGANVHIRNGAGSTSTKNAKGNLIIGYDETAPNFKYTDGSHNFILGPAHSYSSTGGFVAGENNFISKLGCTALGSFLCMALEEHASVHGGWNNWSSARYSACSGGYNCEAAHDWSTASGGDTKITTGVYTHTPGTDGVTSTKGRSHE